MIKVQHEKLTITERDKWIMTVQERDRRGNAANCLRILIYKLSPVLKNTQANTNN